MLKSLFVSTLILLCTTVLESAILSNIAFLLVVPDLVLMCTIYFSLTNGKLIGETTGFISGLLLDFITGIPFGFNCLYRTIICYICGFFANSVIIGGLMVPVVSVGIATIVKTIFINLIAVFFPNTNVYVTGIISYEFLFEFIENIILAPFVFRLLGGFKNSLSIRTTKDRVDNA